MNGKAVVSRYADANVVDRRGVGEADLSRHADGIVIAVVINFGNSEPEPTRDQTQPHQKREWRTIALAMEILHCDASKRSFPFRFSFPRKILWNYVMDRHAKQTQNDCILFINLVFLILVALFPFSHVDTFAFLHNIHIYAMEHNTSAVLYYLYIAIFRHGTIEPLFMVIWSRGETNALPMCHMHRMVGSSQSIVEKDYFSNNGFANPVVG
jgi:hypothetical protein